MKLSARNTLEGKIIAIKKGPVSTEVTITTTSADNLGLEVGKTAFAVIKASNVMVAVE